ncbi:MAG: type II toxin-antitoxin system MqsA family antitoxin [Oscillospiraceae bacterium]|nr:type II toxin-antitoxin system MqsA family antitoxin [Oscillospiraceae bacterium]
MMDCFHCKGSVEPKLKTHVVTLDRCVIIVKNVPAFVCKQCGEAYFSDDVMQNLEAIIDKLEKLVKEVAIVDYADNAA